MPAKFPITIPGLAVFLIALVMLIRSLSARNAYEIILSSAALLLLLILFLIGNRSRKKLAALQPLWAAPLPLAANSSEDWAVTVPVFSLPFFFRLHFGVRGRFFPQGYKGSVGENKFFDGSPVFAETSIPRGGTSSAFRISFPIGGLFRGKGSCRLRDVFGFFSFPCGSVREQSVKVRSSPCAVKALRIDAQSGAEDKRSKTSADEERYYMREYAPGDRFRDINWKSSERIDTIITRISPDNQEKVTRIEVYFRNYGSPHPSMLELWLLDRAKARLAWFMRSVKEEKASYIFNVHTASETRELKDQDEIDAFLDDLASVSFSPPQNEDSAQAQSNKGEIYVFSTECDTALPAFLLAHQENPVSLFISRKVKHGEQVQQSERLRLRDFAAGGSVPLPRWFINKGSRETLQQMPTVRMMTDYAEIGL